MRPLTVHKPNYVHKSFLGQAEECIHLPVLPQRQLNKQKNQAQQEKHHSYEDT